MKIGILADSHDNLPMIRAAMALFRKIGVELIVHAGDFVAPFAVRAMDSLCRVVGVFGNNDGERAGLRKALGAKGEIHPGAASLEIGGKRIVVVHSDSDAGPLAASGRYDVVICGHSHTARVRREGSALVLNPGESGGWLTGKSTAAVLDLDTMDTALYELAAEE
jgi:putative phosphoesterase